MAENQDSTIVTRRVIGQVVLALLLSVCVCVCHTHIRTLSLSLWFTTGIIDCSGIDIHTFEHAACSKHQPKRADTSQASSRDSGRACCLLVLVQSPSHIVLSLGICLVEIRADTSQQTSSSHSTSASSSLHLIGAMIRGHPFCSPRLLPALVAPHSHAFRVAPDLSASPALWRPPVHAAPAHSRQV